MSDLNNYKNKYFSIMGDSISTFEGITPEDYNVFYTFQKKCESDVLNIEDTWWGKVVHNLGGKLLVNNAWSGSLVSKHPLCEIESYGASNARCSYLGKDGIAPDIIMIYIGTNDWGQNTKIYPENCNICDLSYFFVAYDTMLSKIEKNYPQAKIWCITLPLSDKMGEFVMQYKDIIDQLMNSIFDFNNAIIKCAEKHNCKLIDISKPILNFDTFDGLHPNKLGMNKIADAILSKI